MSLGEMIPPKGSHSLRKSVPTYQVITREKAIVIIQSPIGMENLKKTVITSLYGIKRNLLLAYENEHGLSIQTQNKRKKQ